MNMTCKSPEVTGDRATFATCEVVIFEEQELWIMVFNPVIDIRPKTGTGRLKDVIFRNDFSLGLPEHFVQHVKPKGMSRL